MATNDILKSPLPSRVETKVGVRSYCEACGTLDLHGPRCAACGFSFENPDGPLEPGQAFRPTVFGCDTE